MPKPKVEPNKGKELMNAKDEVVMDGNKFKWLAMV